MKNPFILTPLAPGAAFCDRVEELERYARYARDGQKVVLFSPRRYGKTSLMRKLQHSMRAEGMVCPYVDFSTVTNARDVAHVLIESFFAALHEKESLLDKGKRFLKAFAGFRPAIRITERGYSVVVTPEAEPDEARLLRNTVEEIGNFVDRRDFRFCFVFDEFQQIAKFSPAVDVESILRAKIQFLHESFFFVGSKRQMLLNMFTDNKRPFFKMALSEELKPLPEADVVEYLQAEFAKAGKKIAEDVSLALAQTAKGYAYYVQFLAQQCFYLSNKAVAMEHLEQAVEQVLARQDPDFAAVVESPDFPLQQLRLLKALAVIPTSEPMSADFLGRLNLATSTVQGALKRLIEKDLIEKDKSGIYRVVDPFLEMWLKAKSPLR